MEQELLGISMVALVDLEDLEEEDHLQDHFQHQVPLQDGQAEQVPQVKEVQAEQVDLQVYRRPRPVQLVEVLIERLDRVVATVEQVHTLVRLVWDHPRVAR